MSRESFSGDTGALTQAELEKIDALWRAANYLSVGQIYLLDNPLLEKPLAREHIKPRLLGHWGTTPGLNFLYAHLNRAINKHDLNILFITGPGHGGPALVANAYLEGTYSEVYPSITQDEEGMKRLFKQFSFPGGIPSHVAPETPGSIHEGGELGYALSHAFGAAFDNPDLIVACVVGDGEAETGPLATGWHGNKFLNPARDGCVLPILLQWIWREARAGGPIRRPSWPMIVLVTPKGWTCPREIDAKLCEGYWRSHQVPMGEMSKLEHIAVLQKWMKSYRPEELFDETGRLRPELMELAPRGERRMSANPHTNGGLVLRDLRLPDFRDYAVDVPIPGAVFAEATRAQGKYLQRRGSDAPTAGRGTSPWFGEPRIRRPFYQRQAGDFCFPTATRR
jgi:xylulose-5-phosphate/fructose-6-phosphate phosphoketolase